MKYFRQRRAVFLAAMLLAAGGIGYADAYDTTVTYEAEKVMCAGTRWNTPMVNVVYRPDETDICDILENADGTFTVQFTKPGHTAVAVDIYEAGQKKTINYLFHIIAEGSDGRNTFGTAFPNIYGDGTYGRAVGTHDLAGNVSGLVPLEELDNYWLLHWNLTDEELRACYEAAKPFVAQFVGMPKAWQMKEVANGLRQFFEEQCEYSDDTPHFLDAYGFFVLKNASCQGATAATGLCLNMLGIKYEHVNHNQWKHQWCRVPFGDEYWIADPYGLYCGPEPSPYHHPLEENESGVVVVNKSALKRIVL